MGLLSFCVFVGQTFVSVSHGGVRVIPDPPTPCENASAFRETVNAYKFDLMTGNNLYVAQTVGVTEEQWFENGSPPRRLRRLLGARTCEKCDATADGTDGDEFLHGGLHAERMIAKAASPTRSEFPLAASPRRRHADFPGVTCG